MNCVKSKYQFSYYTRIVVVLIIYVIFFVFIINNIIHAENNGAIFFNILMALIGLMATLYEFLRINYDAATKRLIQDDKPEEAIRLANRVDKFDLLKSYKTSTKMLKILALMDLRRFDELLNYSNEIMNEDEKDYDLNLINAYGRMVAYGENNQKGKSNEEFKKLINIRDTKDKKGRRFKGSYYLNWEVVNGQHKNYDGDYTSAFNFLKDINEEKMNKREVVSYLCAKLLASKQVNKKDVYDETKQRLLKLVTNNQALLDYINQMQSFYYLLLNSPPMITNYELNLFTYFVNK